MYPNLFVSLTSLPPDQNFGLDYHTFQHMVGDCPPDFLQLAFNCCNVSPPPSCPISLSQSMSIKILQYYNIPVYLYRTEEQTAAAMYLLKLVHGGHVLSRLCAIIIMLLLQIIICNSKVLMTFPKWLALDVSWNFHSFIFNFLSNYQSLVQKQRWNLII